MNPGIEESRISFGDRDILQDFMAKYRDLFWRSVSTYAANRSELHLKYWVSLSKGHARASTPTPRFLEQFSKRDLNDVYGVLDAQNGGNRWDSALCLWYVDDGKSQGMRLHRDHKTYSQGATTINVIGSAEFLIKDSNDPKAKTSRYLLTEGSVIRFDNKRLHGVKLCSKERAAIVLLNIKPEYKLDQTIKQLSLF